MRLYHVTGIVWDVSDQGDNEEAAAALSLPESAYVHAESEDDIADALSDEYGWCVQSSVCTEVNETLVFGG